MNGKASRPQNHARRVPAGHGYVKRAKRPQRASVSDCFVAWIRLEGWRCKQTSRSVAVWGVAGAHEEARRWLRRQRRELRQRLAKKGGRP